MPPLVNYDSPRSLRAFLDEQGLGMRKKFGQNFLINPAVRSKLLEALELRQGDEVWEIGPGLGAMTAGLLERGALVTAFEIDPAFARILRQFFAVESVASVGAKAAFRLVEGDVLKTWPAASGGLDAQDDLFLLGNLPYNIAAVLLGDFIERGRIFKRIVVTVQKEVGLRICAKPGTADYSAFSVLCSSVYKASPIMTIRGPSFYPAPKVDSMALRLDPLSDKAEMPPLFYTLVRGLFENRRKTLRNTLTNFAASVIMQKREGAASKREKSASDIAAGVLDRAGISGDRRAETLDIAEFTALASFLEETVSNG